MRAIKKMSGEDNMLIILMGILITGLVYQYRTGVLGNDFWWHVKAGEWIVNNRAIPKNIDIFSWYAKENGIKWIPQEWLSEVFLYLIYKIFNDFGIFFLSLFSALVMTTLIILRNKNKIKNNILLSIICLIPIIFLFPEFFYGRPQLISYFLFYVTLLCLYKFKQDKSSKLIYFVPVISILWSNFHGGSAALTYIICFIFMLSGVFEFSLGKLKGEKLSKKQLYTYLVVGIVSILAFIINPNGINILVYPFVNMRDSFMQTLIAEWSSPDAKQLYQLFTFFIPLFIAGVSLIITEKKIKVVDLLIFMFFGYLSFRSYRFIVLFFIATTFFIFDYFVPRKVNTMKTKLDLVLFYIIIIFFMVINIFSITTMVNTFQKGKLISVAMDQKFVELVKEDSPKRIFNDYNFGETLIYNNIDTFVDGREDLFAGYNLRDAIALLTLKQVNENEKRRTFDPEEIIDKYKFDAFLIQADRPLAVYLKSKPEKYKLIMEDNNTIYFKTTS